MKKESIIAITFGIILGGIVAVLVIIQTKENQLKNTKTISAKLTPTVTSTSLTTLQPLQISTPSDQAIVNSQSLKISGKTEINSLIIIQSQIKEVAIKNEKQNFSVDFPLALGENTIKIVAYPKDAKTRPQEKQLKVYYLEE